MKQSRLPSREELAAFIRERSGTASTAKAKASRLWNTIAAETGLPKLAATQL